MNHPCFRRYCCKYAAKGVNPIYQFRHVVGKYPAQIKTSKTILGEEAFCKKCWDALPEIDRFNSKTIDTELNEKNYRRRL